MRPFSDDVPVRVTRVSDDNIKSQQLFKLGATFIDWLPPIIALSFVQAQCGIPGCPDINWHESVVHNLSLKIVLTPILSMFMCRFIGKIFRNWSTLSPSVHLGRPIKRTKWEKNCRPISTKVMMSRYVNKTVSLIGRISYDLASCISSSVILEIKYISITVYQCYKI